MLHKIKWLKIMTCTIAGFIILALTLLCLWYKGSIESIPRGKTDVVNDVENANDVEKIKSMRDLDICQFIRKKWTCKDCNEDIESQPYYDVKLSALNRKEIEECYLKRHCQKNITQCDPPSYHGRVDVHKDLNIFKYAENYGLEFVNDGGWWCPATCRERQSVIILIPFRERDEHLPVLLQHLHPILKRQQLHYRIFVVQQDDQDPFNKGKLINAGFKEIKKLYPYSCIVFQDVDLVPEDDRIDYSCSKSPMHLAGLIDKFDYKLYHPDAFGGVVSFLTKDFVKINGFSNLFWVWGGEDDNLRTRALMNNMKPVREKLEVARYTMLHHVNRMHIRTEQDEKESLQAMKMAEEHMQADGLNSVVYQVNEIKRMRLYTLMKIHLLKANLEIEK